MNGIYSQLGAILLISVSAAIVSFMSPDGEMKKYVDLIARLGVLAAIAVPIIAGITNIPYRISEYEEIQQTEYQSGEYDVISLAKANIESSVAERVEAEFGLKKGSVGVFVELDASDISSIDILSINVTVPRGTDKTSVKNYVLKLFENTSSVSVKEDGYD